MTNTTFTPKFTKKMDFTAIIEILNADKSCEVIDSATADRLIARMEHEIELLDKKNSADRKPTKNQQANEVLADLILEDPDASQFLTAEDVERIMDPHTYIGSAEIIVDEILESSKDWF